MKNRFSNVVVNFLAPIPFLCLAPITSACSCQSDQRQNNIWTLNKDIETNNYSATMIFSIDTNFDNPINLSLLTPDTNLSLKNTSTNITNKQIYVNFVISQNIKERSEFYFSMVFKFVNSYGNLQVHEFSQLHISFIPKYDNISIVKERVTTQTFNVNFEFMTRALPSSKVDLSIQTDTPDLISLPSPTITITTLNFIVPLNLSDEITAGTSIKFNLHMEFNNSYGLYQENWFNNLVVDYVP